MNKIAFVFGEVLIYWNSVYMAAAILVGVLLFWACYIRRSDCIAAAAILCPVAIVSSFLLARLIHWYFRADSYDGLVSAMTDFSGSGYALCGAFFGCLLSAALLRGIGILKNLPLALDCLSIGGSAAIAVGRLSCFFTADNRGDILADTIQLPIAYPVVNTISGMVENRFATFLFQAAVTAVIFVVLLILFLRCSNKHNYRDGDIALLFLLTYCAAQIVLDSTRYDALRLRSNGFISVVQVLCAAALVFTLVLFSIRLCRNSGFKGGYLFLWLLAALSMGVAAYMEYHVQRHGGQALFAYTCMSASLSVTVLLGIILWKESGVKASSGKQYQGKFSR